MCERACPSWTQLNWANSFGLSLSNTRRATASTLLARRKEPLRDAEHAYLLALPDGFRMGPFVYHPDSRFGLTWRTLLGVLNHSGFRKAEWAVRRRGDATLMTYAQLAWELAGSARRGSLSAVERAAIRLGTLSVVALIYPVPSKCDPDGSAFCNKGIPFPVCPLDPESPGTLLLRLEELVSPADRALCPLFADADNLPFVGSDMDRALRDALLAYSPLVAATRSWHSYRIRLASKLRAVVTTGGAPAYSDAVIQALLRWKTPASLLIYARYDTDAYASILRSVQHVDITSVQYANLPETSECARLDLLAETAELELPATLREASPPPAPAALSTRDSVLAAPFAPPLDTSLPLPPSPSHSPASSSSGAPVCPSHSPGGVARPNRRPPFSST